MSKAPVLIELFYDVISPYSFVAFEVICRYQSKWNIDLKLKPFLIAGIMKLSGNFPNVSVPNKFQYMEKDILRLQKYCQIPITLPKNFPEIIIQGSLSAQRFVTAVDVACPQHTESLSRALYQRVFKLHKDILEVESLREAAKSIGMNEKVIEDAITKINDQKIKDRLRDHTSRALEYGGFGAPTIVAHVNGKPEMFFGSDRFELMAHVIGEKWEGPVPHK